MIYFVYGNPEKIFNKTSNLIDSLLAKKPDATVFKVNSENFDCDGFGEFIGGQSLFTKKYIISLSRVFEDSDLKDFLNDRIKEISESDNIFIFTEEKLDAKTLKKIEKYSVKVQKFESKNDIKKTSNGFIGNKSRPDNNFDLADALGERNVKKLWTLYVDRVKKVRAEELHGILWWQIKSMIIARNSSSPADSGLKPFVYSKSRRFSENFPNSDLNLIAEKLIEVVHESRRGEPGLETRLEKLILEI
jgi:DNA polymerase III delta subunit